MRRFEEYPINWPLREDECHDDGELCAKSERPPHFCGVSISKSGIQIPELRSTRKITATAINSEKQTTRSSTYEQNLRPSPTCEMLIAIACAGSEGAINRCEPSREAISYTGLSSEVHNQEYQTHLPVCLIDVIRRLHSEPVPKA